MEIYTNVGMLATLLGQSQVIVFDVESSGLDPCHDVLAGCGFFFPEIGAAAYINTGHFIRDPNFPLTPEQDFVAAIQPFFANPDRQAIAHNATFDLRFLFQLGVEVRCRTTCTLVQTHRVDENLREKADDCTTHPTAAVGYGLKKLVRLFFNEVPPTILDATEGKNTLSAPPAAVGMYCATDCVNTWRVYQRNLQRMDGQARWLLENIDDPNNLAIARMLWQGLGVDLDEASRQVKEYEQAIEYCREEIWATLGSRPLFNKPKALKRLLSELLQTRVFSMTGEMLRYFIKDVAVTERQRKVLANLIVRKQMQQRLSSFLRPLPQKAMDGRIHASRFSSTLVTTRFSSNPNLQNMPKRADKVSEEDDWLDLVPEKCKPAFKTRNIITAAPGCVLIELDYSAAEPRYLAAVFQQAIHEKDAWYQNERAMLRKQREARHGELIQRMRETRKKKAYVANDIVWPTYEEDPLWRVFRYGIPTSDPYNALLSVICHDEYLAAQSRGCAELEKWFEDERWRGKRAWLALAYGSQASTLAPKLKWSVERTQAAIVALETEYAMLPPLRELTLRSVLHLGKVKTLWGRMRRLNGFYQLAGVEPVKIRVHYAGDRNNRTGKSSFRRYEAEIIPLGSWRRGVQAFVRDCWYINKDGTPNVSVLRATEDGMIASIDERDYFVRRDHYNRPPFRNIPFAAIEWVQEANGLIRYLGRQEHAERQAFNFLAQGCGADHLRWTMNAIDAEICTLEEFRDCRLVLTIHDSLCYEVPQEKAQAFIAAITPVARRRPDWRDFDIKISVEVGRRMGELKPP